jgi:microcystin-dependent protein
LFTAVGETWGAGDGESTFNLPPGAVFFINAARFVADSRVPLTTLTQPDGTTTTNGQGVAAQGGSSTSAPIRTSDLPAMMTTLRAEFPHANNFIGQTGKTGVGFPNFQPQGYGSPDTFQDQPLADAGGNALGANQAPLVTLPPYCTINYIIKWQ